MIKRIIFCVLIFILGLAIGNSTSRIVEVEVIKQVEVPYLNVAEPDFANRLEVVANLIGKTVKTIDDEQKIIDLHKKNYKEIEELHRSNKAELQAYRGEIDRLYDKRKEETAKMESYWWTIGYKEGYRSARER